MKKYGRYEKYVDKGPWAETLNKEFKHCDKRNKQNCSTSENVFYPFNKCINPPTLTNLVLYCWFYDESYRR